MMEHPHFTVRKFHDGVAHKSDLEQLQPDDILFKGNHIGVWTGSMIAEDNGMSQKVYGSCDFELKPCPLCGGEATVHEYKYKTVHNFTIYCDDCGLATLWYDTEAEVIKAWNTRAACDDCQMGMKPMTDENMAAAGWVRERTCQNLAADKDGQFLCSECRDSLWTGLDNNEIRYCPNCGAKVVK